MEIYGHNSEVSSAGEVLEGPEPGAANERPPESPRPRTEPAFEPPAPPKYPTLGYE